MERTESLIQEKRKILRVAYQLPDEMNGSPRSPLIPEHVEAEQDPQTSEKPVQRTKSSSAPPRFMASTECSRQREKTAELMGRWRAISTMNRKSIDLFGSQSLSFSTHDHLISSTQTPKKRAVTCYKRKDMSSQSKPDEASHDGSVDSKGFLLSRTKKASASNPSLRVAMHQHRRRMSDLV